MCFDPRSLGNHYLAQSHYRLTVQQELDHDQRSKEEVLNMRQGDESRRKGPEKIWREWTGNRQSLSEVGAREYGDWVKSSGREGCE